MTVAHEVAVEKSELVFVAVSNSKRDYAGRSSGRKIGMAGLRREREGGRMWKRNVRLNSSVPFVNIWVETLGGNGRSDVIIPTRKLCDVFWKTPHGDLKRRSTKWRRGSWCMNT